MNFNNGILCDPEFHLLKQECRQLETALLNLITELYTKLIGFPRQINYQFCFLAFGIKKWKTIIIGNTEKQMFCCINNTDELSRNIDHYLNENHTVLLPVPVGEDVIFW